VIDVCITVDAESTKQLRGDVVVHLEVQRNVERPLNWLAALGIPLTVFLPLSELALTWPGAAETAGDLAHGHDVGVHRHLPFGSLTAVEVAESLAHEAALVAEATGRRAVSVRAGAFATGDQRTWIDAAAAAGLRVDSSVVAGASTEAGWEGRLAAEREGALFGGGIAYDYRGAPAAGAYRASADSLTIPGVGPLVEAPVSCLFYDEQEPRALALDVHAMSTDLLLRGLEWLDHVSGGEGLAVVLAHTYGLVRGSRPTVVGRRVEAVADWARDRGSRLRTLAELADDPPGPVWAPNQDERWESVDRSALSSLVGRPVVRLTPRLLDARTDNAPFFGSEPARRRARYARAALSLSGGLAAAVFVLAALPFAALARRLRGGPSKPS
jgi:hypothetical protein